MPYSFEPMDEPGARTMLGWQYEAPYSYYNVEPEYVDAAVSALLDPAWAYYRMDDEQGDLIGFCCFGEDARVPGGDYADDALDVGWGMRPDLTGQGRGAAFVNAILDFGRRTYSPAMFRTTVATFNQRSRRASERAGFRAISEFTQPNGGMSFVILIRPA